MANLNLPIGGLGQQKNNFGASLLRAVQTKKLLDLSKQRIDQQASMQRFSKGIQALQTRIALGDSGENIESFIKNNLSRELTDDNGIGLFDNIDLSGRGKELGQKHQITQKCRGIA